MKFNAVLLIVMCLLFSRSVSAQNQSLDSLLQLAIQENNVEKTKQLISSGADINMRFNSGLAPTPLMWASGFPDGQILKMLIKANASLNEVDTNGDPAINWAAYYGHLNNMNELLKAGADVGIVSKHGDALDVAYRLWHADSVINVFKGSKLEKDISIELEKLIKSIRDKKYAKVQSFIDKDVSVNSLDGLGMSLLHHAVRSGDKKMVILLLENGANPNILNRVGQAPLTIAARFGYLDVVEELIKSGANANAAGEKYKLTPLIGSAVGGNEKAIQKLIDAGANIDQKDVVNQSTPLHWAIFYGNNEAVKLLIDKGASYSLKCLDDQYTAYALALGYQNKEIKNYIENKRANTTPIIGSWKIDEIHYIYSDTTYKMKALQGSLLIDDKRYSIMYNPSPRPRTPFKSLSKPTEEEILAGFRSIVFNTGPYDLIDDNVMLALPDLAKVPGFEGGKQYYKYSLEGDKLYFRMYDETYPNGDKPEWFGKVEVQFILTKE